MATVTGLTAQRMIVMEQATIIGGLVDAGGYLQLQTRGGTKVNAGLVKGKDATALLEVLQSDTATLTLTGLGTPVSPWKIRVDVKPVFDKIRLTSGSDASLTSTNHAFQVGGDTGLNIIMDENEMMARNNGEAATLGINWEGGNIGLGHSSSTVSVPGRFDHYLSNKVLWSGAMFMNSGQVATLNTPVLEQTHGVVLCWTRYSGGPVNDNASYDFIPKWHVQNKNGTGITLSFLSGSNGATITTIQKYVYLANTTLTGNANNDVAPANTRVLVAIIGV